LGAKYAEVGCKSMDTFGCMSMPFATFRKTWSDLCHVE